MRISKTSTGDRVMATADSELKEMLPISVKCNTFLKQIHKPQITKSWGFPGDSDCKESAGNVGDLGLNPGLGRSPGEMNGNSLQYSCLENSMDRGAWQATVHGVTKRQT